MPEQMQLDLAPSREARSAGSLRSVAYRPDAWSSLVTSKPETVARIVRNAKQGLTADFVRAAIDAEEKDGEIQQAMGTRKAAVTACQIAITPADDSVQAARIAEAVREVWDQIPGKLVALKDLLDAIPLGFSMSQIILSEQPVDGLWRVERLETIPPEALIFRADNKVLDFPRLRTKKITVNGLDLEPYRELLIFHQQRKKGSCLLGGLMRTLLWYSLFKRFNLKDWISFNERYGDPLIVGTYNQGASDKDQAALHKAVKALGTDAAAVISEATNIKIVEAAKKSSVATFNVFRTMIDAAIVKVVLGQTKTSEGEGGSYALATVHNDVRGDITADDTVALAETLDSQLIKRLVIWNFGPAALKLSPEIQIVYQEPSERAQEAATLKTAVELGVDVPVSHARKVLGIPEPQEGEEVLSPPGGGGAPPFSTQAEGMIRGRPWLLQR